MEWTREDRHTWAASAFGIDIRLIWRFGHWHLCAVELGFQVGGVEVGSEIEDAQRRAKSVLVQHLHELAESIDGLMEM